MYISGLKTFLVINTPIGNNCAKYKHPKSKVEYDWVDILMVGTHKNLSGFFFVKNVHFG